ncbi:lipopolysaccharide biosynthesis protein [Spirosoma endbachense]|uniref:Lipopolysaccharide biosynthesis protein n=1 Tax=Spirosoma endbachense TaxID=2666025 RepID=A0A6P1VSQ1_9BACT|nr:oligosaccharide flippase family protein [Spirosoma endbachense]QHV96261.1 lipopolysaccharide biosynthesis protein [Spirosoma endbachense]
MGIIKRQTIQSSIYSYAGVGVGFLTQGLFFLYLFSKEQVGLLSLLVSVSLVLAQASNLGLNSAGGRYFPYFRNIDRQHNGYLLIATLTTIFGCCLCALVLWLARPWVIEQYQTQSALFVDYYYLLIPLMLFTVFFAVFDNYARLLYDPVTGTLLQQLVQRVLILLAGILYWFGWVTFPQFLGVWLLAFLIPMILMIYSVAQDESLFLNRRFIAVGPELRNNLIRYSALTLTTALSTQIIWTIDKAMLSTSKGLDDTGVYSTASYFASVIALPATALYKVSGTLIAESWKANDMDNIMTIYRKSCLNQLIAGCLVFVGVAVNLPTVFAVLPAGYEAGYYVILWLGLSKLIDMATGVNGVILGTSRYYAYDSVFFVLLIFVTILANKLLIPQYGMNGAAVGAVLATFLYNFARTVLVGIKFGLQPFTWRNLAVIALAALVWFLVELVPHATGSWLLLGIDVVLRSSAITALFLAGVYVFNLSPDASELMNSVWQRIKKLNA